MRLLFVFIKMKPFGWGTVLVGFLIPLISGTIAGALFADFHGTIKEDAAPNTEVKFDSNIFVKDITTLAGGKVCGYTLYKSGDELPFTVTQLNKTTGEARLVLKPGFQLKVQTYTFEIAAHDCIQGEHAERLLVHIEVEPATPAHKSTDTDPSWQQDSYKIEVEEGKLYDDILQLEVEGLPKEFENTCKFAIISADVPFTIDNKEKLGILRNTEKLDYSRQHNFILQVKAEGCGETEGKANKPLVINIVVKETCKQGWQGIQTVLDYEPDSGIKVIADNVTLKLCDDSCQVKDVKVKVKLVTDHIGKGCDRDTYSLQSQRKICGAASSVVDLLPDPIKNKFAEGLHKDDGNEGDEVYLFDGKTRAVEVPTEMFNRNLAKQFTIMTWMRHEKPTDNIDQKEHILCNADGDGKNRHHYALYIHHCKLVLLLRREFHSGIDLNEFNPAEWRWLSDEFCDGQWHHIAVSVDYPSVRLYIDGKRFTEQNNNPEIIDDWALHPANSVHFTKLYVGACWMGSEKRLDQYFHGYLAGLSILNGQNENDRVLSCLNSCMEKLDFHAMQDMESGMSLAFNSEFSEISIEGQTVKSVEKLLHKVGYVNSRHFPTQGHRSIHITTDVTCTDGKKATVSDVDTQIFVMPAAHPIISITGTQVLSKEESELVHGVAVFRDISIMSKTEAERAELEHNDIKSQEAVTDDDSPYKLDSCMIRVSPAMDFNNFNKEHFKYPENLIDQLMLEAFQNEDGLIISGAEKVSNYVSVLRQVKYYHSEPEAINGRTCIVTCSELNGRFVSNEFKVQLEVIHIKPGYVPSQDNSLGNKPQAPALPNQAPQYHSDSLLAPVDRVQSNKIVETQKEYSGGVNHLDKSAFMGSIGQSGKVSSVAGAGLGMIIIIVVCVGFLMFMIVLGVLRIRSAQVRSGDVQSEEKAEMEWDNSALTITVNPMDQDNAYEENELAGVHGDDTDSDDDSDFHDDHDDADSSEEEAELRELKGRGLEWDESDLSKYQCKV